MEGCSTGFPFAPSADRSSKRAFLFSERPHATRFIIPILAAAREEWSAEIFDAIVAKRPRIVVIGSGLSTLTKATQHRGEYLPVLAAWVRIHYALKASIGRFRIYELPDEEEEG